MKRYRMCVIRRENYVRYYVEDTLEVTFNFSKISVTLDELLTNISLRGTTLPSVLQTKEHHVMFEFDDLGDLRYLLEEECLEEFI